MKDILVGYTGFVGSNIAFKHNFEGLFNSKNIDNAFGSEPDLLVYCGVPSAMFLANNFPDKDLEVIKNAMNNIKKIEPKTVVLISTIAVYNNPVDVNENSAINIDELTAYGKNRLLLEKYVEENFENHLIIRLPALFGRNLKKNFIYDYIHIIPSLLTESKFSELAACDGFIKDFYSLQDNGFYKCREINKSEESELKTYFKNIGFSALNFTDSRSVYQFYDLSDLWTHIEIALNNGVKKLNLATEPIVVSELYKYLSGDDFKNELSKPPFNYDYKTEHFEIFGGRDGYIFDKNTVLHRIREFVTGEIR